MSSTSKQVVFKKFRHYLGSLRFYKKQTAPRRLSFEKLTPDMWRDKKAGLKKELIMKFTARNIIHIKRYGLFWAEYKRKKG